jgi:hypothetical protein
MLLLSLVACGEGSSTKDPEGDRPIQLSIQLFEGGYGRVWLDKVVAAYEAIRTDVNITVKTTVNSTSAEQLVNAGKSPYDIVMLNYGFWQDSYDGKIVDLTDVYLSTPEGESATIMDKCNDTIVEFFNIGTAENPKFNQMSWASATSALCYNKTTLDLVLAKVIGRNPIPLTNGWSFAQEFRAMQARPMLSFSPASCLILFWCLHGHHNTWAMRLTIITAMANIRMKMEIM